MVKIAVALILLVAFSSCENSVTKMYTNLESTSGNMVFVVPQEHPGKQLMENNCYLCHNPKTSEENSVAPPLKLVKQAYMTDFIGKEEFIGNLVLWIKNPKHETSKMPNAVKEYGLMPYQFYPENTLRQIATYMFENEIEAPEWFKKNKCGKKII